MDLDNDDEILRSLAQGNLMDYEQWPALLSRLIPRLEKIVKEDFPPLPSTYLHSPSQPSQQPSTVAETSSQNSTTSSQTTNKENAPPTSPNLNPQLTALLTSIISTLTILFAKHPPHTIQRLAELILAPKQHYRTLPSYLHAVDRVVHVTSGAHIFPLPPAIPDPSSASVLSNGTATHGPSAISWGTQASLPQSSLGSDESLGGALLTPITWLKVGNGTRSPLEREVKTESTEMVEGPNGLGGVETVSVSVNGVSSTSSASLASSNSNNITSLRAEGGVTQGELLRQEQRAGVVPVAQLASGRSDPDNMMSDEDEIPHARGPEEIGMEDMGPQSSHSASERGGPAMAMQGIDVEAAVGRKVDVKAGETDGDEPRTATTPKREAEEELENEGKRVKEDTGGDGDGDEDMGVVVDADGREEGEKKVGEQGENKGVDAVDTSTVS